MKKFPVVSLSLILIVPLAIFYLDLAHRHGWQPFEPQHLAHEELPILGTAYELTGLVYHLVAILGIYHALKIYALREAVNVAYDGADRRAAEERLRRAVAIASAFGGHGG